MQVVRLAEAAHILGISPRAAESALRRAGIQSGYPREAVEQLAGNRPGQGARTDITRRNEAATPARTLRRQETSTMNMQEILQMRTIGADSDGQVVTVIGIPSHQTTDTDDAHGSIWLTDGVAVQVLFDQEAWSHYSGLLRASAILVRGRVEWTRKSDRTRLMRLHAEYVEPRRLLGIQTEKYGPTRPPAV